MNVEQIKDANAAADGKEARAYERSTIEFPYNDLDDAVAVAKAIHRNAGTACTIDQLAAFLKQSMTSGAFRGRVSNAGTFRLTENERGTLRLTPLGMEIVDPNREPAARAEAFLRVPLYHAIHEKYRGYTLPSAAALEKEMLALGVSSRQTDKARQAFMRSARQAGFFAHGEDRLVRPAFSGTPTTRPVESPKEETAENRSGGGGGGGDDIDPIIRGLLARLPKSGAVWPSAERKLWLAILENSFRLIYEDAPPGTAHRLNENIVAPIPIPDTE